MPNIRKRSGRTVNEKCLVSEREPYSLENRLNSCEVRKVHDDGDDDDDDGGDADECN